MFQRAASSSTEQGDDRGYEAATIMPKKLLANSSLPKSNVLQCTFDSWICYGYPMLYSQNGRPISSQMTIKVAAKVATSLKTLGG